MPDKIVATTLALPEPPPLQGAGHFSDQVSWALYAIGAVIAGFFWLRRKASRDNTEITKDRAETNLVETLREERDRATNEARAAWSQRTTDAQRIASLEMENQFLRRDVAGLTQRVNELRAQLEEVMSKLQLIPQAPAV